MAAQEGSYFYVQENLPPGYRFIPTEKELLYYLNLKILNKRISIDAIKDVDLYNYHPHDLCQSTTNGIRVGYFFTSRTKKYHKGSRPDRRAAGGYWKATGGDVIVQSNVQEVGRKKVLVYYERKSKNNKGTKTNWIMHEFTIHQIKDGACSSTDAIPDDMMLDVCVCKIYYRAPKSSEKEEQDTERNMIPIQETHVHSTNLAATSCQNPVPALDQSSSQGAYIPDQQASIIDQYYPFVDEPVTYMHGDMAMQSNILQSPHPLAYIIPCDQSNDPLIQPEPGMESNDQYQPNAHMNGDLILGMSGFVASTSNDGGDCLDLTTPNFSPLFGSFPAMDPSTLDYFLGESSNARLQSSLIPLDQSITQMQGEEGEWLGDGDFADSIEYMDLPSPKTFMM